MTSQREDEGPAAATDWQSARQRDEAMGGPVVGASLLVALLLLLLPIVGDLNREISADPRLPLWDGAKYGLDGLRLAQALGALDLVEAAGWIYGMDVWGPVFPLLEAGVFLVAGDESYDLPRRLQSVLFALLVAATAGCGMALARQEAGGPSVRAAAVGLLAASLVATSPMIQLFTTLTMLEMPGALLAVVAFWAWCRGERTGRLRDWRLTWIATLLLLFTKTNYAVLWLAPLLLLEATDAAGGLRPLLAKAARQLGRIDWRRPFILLCAALVTVLLGILLTGGIDLRLGGVRLRATSLGNPLYALYLLLVLRALFSGAQRRRWAAERWRRLAPRWRSFALWVALPLGIWMLLPPHLKETVGFLENRSSRLAPWSAESVLFYPRAIVRHYTPWPLVGWCVLLLPLSLPARWSRLGRPRRLLALLALGGLLAAMGHDYKLPRFVFTVVPFLFLAAAVASSDLLALAGRRVAGDGAGRQPRRLTTAVLLAITLPLAAVGAWRGAESTDLRVERRARTAPIVGQAVLSTLGAETGDLVVLGTWNDFSPALIEWQLRRSGGRSAAARLLEDWRRLGSERDLGRIHAALSALPTGTSVVTLRVTDPAALGRWTEEVGWLQPLFAVLDDDPAFVRRRVPQLENSGAPEDSGYRVDWFVRR